MAVTKIHRTSRTSLIITMIVTIVVIALFLFGGEVAPENKIVPDMFQPVFTDLMLYWLYILLAITIVSLLLFAIVNFFKLLKTSPKKALGGLFSLIGIAALFGITYTIGSGELLNLPGYDGPDNTPGTLKMTDMFIYSMYVLLVLTIGAMIISPLLSRRK